VNALKYFSIKSLLEVGHVPPLLFILRFMTSLSVFRILQ
jgi:hypothetical protein